MNWDLKGKVAIVTGGYKGLGEAISLELASQGAKVAIVARSLQECQKLTKQITDQGGQAMAVAVDVSDEKSVVQMVEQVTDKWSEIDFLINNAAYPGLTEWIVNFPLDEWEKVMAVNLRGPFLCCKAVLPDMIEKGRGKIVNVASGVNEERVDFGVSAYYAAKAGLINFTRQLAAETKRHGVFVNAIDPGGMITKTWVKKVTTDEDTSDDFAFCQTNRDQSKRWRRPEQIVPMVMFLLSEQSDMMTGRFLQASSQDDVQYLQL